MKHTHHQPYFEVVSPAGSVRRFSLTAGPLIIGRDAQAPLQLDSHDVSRRHAELQVDGLGRWSVRDLASRNGTFVNGQRLRADGREEYWRVLEPGDQITISGFTLTLMIGSPALEQAMGYDVSYNVKLSDADAGPVSTLENSTAARITPSQLQVIGGLALRLLHVEMPVKRLEALCDLMLGHELRGLAASVLGLIKDRPDDTPRTLIAPRFSPDWPKDRALHVSRTAIRGALVANAPVLARAGHAPANVELSIASSSDLSVIACPLGNDPRVMPLLYAVFPADLGTTDWLALVSLAARQFDTAEAAWRLRSSPTRHGALTAATGSSAT